jgi:hypothetical protein
MRRARAIRYAFLVFVLVEYLFLPAEQAVQPKAGMLSNPEVFSKAKLLQPLALYVLIGSLIGLIVGPELIKVFRDQAEDATQQFVSAVRDGIKDSVGEGLSLMSAAVAAEISKALPGAFHTPVAEKTVAQGIRQIRQPAIANLVESNITENWNEALHLLERVPVADPVDYLPLAFRYWKAANVEQAIRVCEIGMHKTPAEERRIHYGV